jgi:hypothetical protein
MASVFAMIQMVHAQWRLDRWIGLNAAVVALPKL